MSNKLPIQPSKINQLFCRFGYYSKPSFIIIGAQKSGTTALWKYLKMHPNIVPAVRKEIHYFCYDANYLIKGKGWYHSHFPLPHQLKHNQISFEASPNTLYLTKSFERMHRYDPNLKILIILRDPTYRAYSAWNHYRTFSRQNVIDRLKINGRSETAINGLLKLWKEDEYIDFVAAIDIELEAIYSGRELESEPAIVRKGLYAQQIEKLLQFYPKNQVLIIDIMEFRQFTIDILCRIFNFLDLPKYNKYSSLPNLEINSRDYPCELSKNIKSKLDSFYKKHNEKLEKLLNKKFSWGCS